MKMGLTKESTNTLVRLWLSNVRFAISLQIISQLRARMRLESVKERKLHLIAQTHEHARTHKLTQNTRKRHNGIMTSIFK